MGRGKVPPRFFNKGLNKMSFLSVVSKIEDAVKFFYRQESSSVGGGYSGCGYAIGDTGLCADDCQFDGEFPHPHFEAVYKVTTEFLRDEQK